MNRRSLLRRLLELDRPYRDFDDEALESEIRRNYRWNLAANVGDVAFFFLGASFVAATTILPLFISKLTSSTLAVGMVAMLAQGGWYLPQLFTANATERVPRMLPIVVNIGFFSERLPILLLVLAAALAVASPAGALLLTLLAYAWHTLGAGAIAPAWQELVARCFPVNRRGFYMGFGSFVGTGVGAVGSAASVALLTALPYPQSFVAVFSAGAVCILASLICLSRVREPVPARRPSPQSTGEFWLGVRQMLTTEDNFRRYLTSRVMMGLGAMGIGFLTLGAIRTWHVSDGTVGAYTGLSLLGQAGGMLVLGLLADRRGHKLSLLLGTGAFVVAFALVAWSPVPAAYYAAFVLIGFGFGAQATAGIMLTLEFAAPGRQPTYAGLVNTSLGLAGIVAPLAGAWLAARSFTILFLLSAILELAALVMLLVRVADPRHTPLASTAPTAGPTSPVAWPCMRRWWTAWIR